MAAEVMDNTSRVLGEMNQTERRMLFRRSHSEPVNPSNEAVAMTSRTEPEWNVTVDSISIQSSFVEYQHRRRERLRIQEEQHKEAHIPSDASDVGMQVPNAFNEFPEIQMPSTLSLTNSDNTHSSNDITSSQAKEISYEEEMRSFIETSGHLSSTVDQEERKSRTEMWVEASTESLAEEPKMELGKVEEAEEARRDGKQESERVEEEDVEPETRETTPEKPQMIHQNTEESVISSTVSVSSLKKSTYTMNLKEATEAQSEIDVNDVDRFWDYLYEKDSNYRNGDLSFTAPLNGPSTSASDRSIGMSLSPVKVNFAGIQTNKTVVTVAPRMSKDEKDRELDEVLAADDQTVENRFFKLQPLDGATSEATSLPVLMRTTASQTPLPTRFSGNGSDKENVLREFSFKLSETLYKDLKVLIVERDRAKEAMRILPAKSMRELSEECNYFQTRYRVRIEQNKEKLDRRIEEIWKTLLKMPIESQEIIDFISVAHSDQLTVNARRNLPEMFCSE
ncbi:unnamed protein product [Caenorhabditis sp. 36 PRJEB53466]|nr:unnamed protein product [Caenorhabditis sp. 36 PRJEB53466]